jgi:hypothetical protein
MRKFHAWVIKKKLKFSVLYYICTINTYLANRGQIKGNSQLVLGIKELSHITFQLYTADIQQEITMHNKMAIFTLKVFIPTHYIPISKRSQLS